MFDVFDFSLLEKKEFKEDSVREVVILPILNALGFENGDESDSHELKNIDKKIIRSKKLTHPFVSIGSKEKPILVYPDYLLEHRKKIILVLDAKSPRQNIRKGKNVNQVYSYAMHPEIRCELYALCNGYEMVFFKTNEISPVLIIDIAHINDALNDIRHLLFKEEKESNISQKHKSKKDEKWYLNKKLPDIIEKPKKQSTSRHFGVHGYFTKQSWDIVNRYINHFTGEGDTVLDPFGGSGVTLIESLISGRNGIHIDLNPLSIFWMETILTEVDLYQLKEQGSKIVEKFKKEIKKITLKDVQQVLPENLLILSKGADAKNLHKIFSKKQLKELGYLKQLILKVKNKNIRKNLLLAFSSTLTQNNLTYHTSKTVESNSLSKSKGSLYGGDSGVFRYYRYRIAPNPTLVDLKKSFSNKLKNLIKAKKEIEEIHRLKPSFQVYKGDATDLKIRINDHIKTQEIKNESVDYIYTDPPYGKKIEYLDLSVMWNAWLDLKVTDEDYQREAIEGGHLDKSKETYSEMIVNSLKEMFRVLKWNRWMSFVFQHQDKDYWYLIVESAEKMGFEYKGVVRQDNGQTSFKKRQNPFSVLSGQLIITFIKKKNPKTMMKADLGGDVNAFILNNIEAVMAEKNGATINEINDSLVINALEIGFLDKLSKYGDLTPYLQENFDYDNGTSKYHIKPKSTFKSHIPMDKRIEYFVLSYLRRNNRENKYPGFSDIVYDIMPLLKNGRTPKDQEIKKILEKIAIPDKKLGGYILKENDGDERQLRLL